MPILAVATAVTAGASIYSANKGAKAAKQASQQAAQAADKEIALQREARDEARQIFTPYSQEGAAARSMINGAMGVGPAAAVASGRAAYDQGFDASPYWRDAQYGAEQSLNALRSTGSSNHLLATDAKPLTGNVERSGWRRYLVPAIGKSV